MKILNDKAVYSAEKLKKLIDCHDAISFDIFDTLVMRTVYFNKDVFRIVAGNFGQVDAEKFFKWRVYAEFVLSRNGYPFIENIYKIVSDKLGLCDELAERMMRYEIEVEKKVIVPRQASVEIFNYCKRCGKKIYIISDMYLRCEFLEKILKKFGIFGYEKVFVSCEYNTSKSQNLFRRYLSEVKAKSYLHIGDSEECDIVPSSMVGMDNFRVKTAAELWETAGGTVPEDLCERGSIAELISDKYNNPFALCNP